MTSNAFDNPLPEQIEPLREANARLRAELAERKQTEEALRLALRASRTGLWDWNVQEGEIYFSAEWKAQIGYEDHEVPNSIGEWERRLHPSDRQWVLSKLSAYLTDQWSNYEVEFRLQHKDGSYRWILSRARLFTDYAGRPMRMLGSHVDITERKRAEQALQDSEEQFRALAESASDAIFTIDTAGRVAFINRAAERVFGYSREEMLKSDLTMVLPGFMDYFGLMNDPSKNDSQNRSWAAAELSGVRKDGSLIPLEISLGEFTRLEKRFFNGIARDISERKRTEEALRRSEKLYRLLAKNFPNGGVALFDDELRYLVADGTELARVGLSKEGLEGRTIWEVFPPDVSKALEPVYRTALAGISTVEEISLRGNTYLRHAVPVSDERGEIIGGMVMSQDITDRKRMEDALRTAELEYRTLVESVQAIVWRADARTLQFSFVSKEAEHLLGYPAEQWTTDPEFWRNHIYPDDRDLAVSCCTRATEEARDHVFEYRMVAADGRVVWLRDIVRVVAEGGAVRELLGVMVDITERKKAEELVRQSEKRFRTLAETTPSAIVVYNFNDGRIRYVNSAMQEIFGYSQSELLSTTIWDLIHTDSITAVTARREARLRGEDVAPRIELKLITKNGEPRWVDQSTAPIEFEGNAAMICTAFDITERKRAEEALRLSEERYRLIVENQTEFIVKWRPDGTRTFVNDSYCRYFGLTENECIGTSFFPLIAPEFRDEIELRTKGLTPDAPEYTEEHLSVARDEMRWQQWKNCGIFDSEGKLVELLSTGSDITERKSAEEALQESESRGRRLNERFSLAVESAGIGVWDLDLLNNELTWDHQMNRLYQIETIGFSGAYNAWSERVHSDDLSRVEHEVQDAIRGVKAFDTDFRILWPSGEERNIKAFARVVRDEQDKPIRMTGINYDITDRKRAERSLRESEAQYRALVENTPDIIARFDCDSRYLFVNSAVSQVSARALDGFVGKRPSEVGFSEDQAAFREGVIRRVFNTRKPFETEFEFEGPTGMSTFEWRVYPEFDAAGNIQSVLSINRDITERKRAEEEVTQSRELLRALSARLQSIREEERTMIAREIHDELGQALTGLKMDLSSLQKSLRKTGELDLSRLTEKTTTMGQLIDSTIQTVRKIATDLRPGILDDLGLVAAIEWQSQDFQKRTGIKCNFTPDMDELDLNAERSTTLFRILQETLTNVARHSEATEVVVTLDRDENHLALEIRDNGKGISQTEISGHRSLGLLGMRERAQRLGGDLTISGAPGKGTIVTARIPLTSEQMESTRQ
jgi:PAS domain S-box-containing protein